ncbi:signal peptidase I [Blastococcus sp. TF02-09]|uniref:signal peptidase I n=1 Tax=Blastococcus sp. TF02-09 TaxID=2250576 RepID=UPI000DEB5282|nr:signal peptidase I [Blastococcus sp. TF02-9]RBY74423.1 signal peptidase I [Blastococcus sp. TF02-9]
MNAATKIASTSAAVALVLVGLWLFWPTSLGGGTTYVVTHGQSMEPGFSTGDLAVLRPTGSYEVGDVVAYRSESLDTVVMHRIVAVDGDRFVIQGDNNDFLDRDRPTADQLLGKLFRQVPQGGKILDAVTSPWLVALVAAAALGVFSSSQRAGGRHSARRPARHRSARRRPAVPRSLPASFSMPTRAQARQVGIGAAVVAVLAAVGGAALLALPSTETGTRTEDVAQEGRWTYAGDARVGTTYPTGEISTGDPVYTRLADAVTVSFEHTVSAEDLEEVAGTLRLDLAVQSADGWSAPLGSSPAAPVQDGTAVASALLDPARAATLVDRHDAEIGGSAGSASIVVTPVVEVTGSLSGRSFTATQPTPFTFAMDGVALRPSADEAAYTPSASVAVSLEEVVPRAFTVLGVDVPIGVARVLAITVLLGAVLVAAVAAGISHSYTGDAADAFAVRNAARILPVAGLTPGRSVVDVSDAQALRRVAERVDGLVLHHAGPEGQTFAVQDNETTYRFVFPDTAITRTPPPPPPAPSVLASLAAPVTSPLPRIA